MSSAADLTMGEDYEPITLYDWLAFCRKHQIRHSPNTMGQNVFYRDDIEITFGEYVKGNLPKLPDGRPDFSKAKPYAEATHIRVSTFYGGNLHGVARMAGLIWTRWNATTMAADPEIQRAILGDLLDDVETDDDDDDDDEVIEGVIVDVDPQRQELIGRWMLGHG